MRFPVVSQNALKSGTEPGSVANTSKVAPFGNPESAFRVLRIGSGQARPFKSKVLSAMRGLQAGRGRRGARPQISNHARNWQQCQANCKGAPCVPAAPT